MNTILSDPSHVVFQVRNLTKVYDMGEAKLHALRGIDFELLPGELINQQRGLAAARRSEEHRPAGFTKISSLGVEEQRVLVIVDLTSPAAPWQGLGDGYRLDASFVLWEGKDVLQVAASAIFRKGDGWALYVIDRDRARLRAVTTEYRNGLAVEVLSGVPEGAFAITHPDDTVRDSVPVQVRK